MAKLVRRGTRQEHPLTEGVVRLGRMPTNDIQVVGKMVSRLHCRVEASPNGWTLTDCGSKLGTFVNGELMMRPHLLRSGDEVRVGGTTFVFEDERQPVPPAPPDVHPLSDNAAAKLVPEGAPERRSRTLPVLLVALLALLAVGALVAILLLTREGPRQVVLRAAELLRGKNAPALWTLLSSEAKLTVTFEEFEERVKAVPAEACEALRRLEVGRWHRTERGVVVPVVLRVGERRLDGEVVLFREDGRWRIHAAPTRRLAELTPEAPARKD